MERNEIIQENYYAFPRGKHESTFHVTIKALKVPSFNYVFIGHRPKKINLYLCLVSKKICKRKCGFLGEKGHLGSQHVLQLRKLLKELMEMASLLLLQVFFLIWVFLRFLFRSVFRLVWLLRKGIERKFNFNFNFLCYFV